jgi:hypothetical protein
MPEQEYYPQIPQIQEDSSLGRALRDHPSRSRASPESDIEPQSSQRFRGYGPDSGFTLSVFSVASVVSPISVLEARAERTRALIPKT